jgi:hypothetical protein
VRRPAGSSVPGEQPPPALERAIGRVMPVAGGEPVGRVIPLGPFHCATCGHVLNIALGREREDRSDPGDAELLLMFRSAGSSPGWRVSRVATVVTWRPGEVGGWFASRDVAVLQLAERLPATVVAPPLRTGPVQGTVRMCGPGPGPDRDAYIEGVVRGQAAPDLLQIDLDQGNVFDAVHGFSGGPVWLPDTGEVVGMVVDRARIENRTAVYAVASVVVEQVPLPTPAAEQTETGSSEPPARRPHRRRRPRPMPSPTPGAPTSESRRARRRGALVERWVRHPVPLLAAGACGLVAAGISATRVGPGWALLYGARAALVVHLAGVATGLVTGLAAVATRRGRSGTAGAPPAEAPTAPTASTAPATGVAP